MSYVDTLNLLYRHHFAVCMMLPYAHSHAFRSAQCGTVRTYCQVYKVSVRGYMHDIEKIIGAVIIDQLTAFSLLFIQ